MPLVSIVAHIVVALLVIIFSIIFGEPYVLLNVVSVGVSWFELILSLLDS